LTKEEFMATKSGKSKPEQAAKAFARLDKDGNGSVSKDEFIQAPAKKPAGDKAAAAEDDDAG
jgi:Ca2+-binding EF-hand superfamily protein